MVSTIGSLSTLSWLVGFDWVGKLTQRPHRATIAHRRERGIVNIFLGLGPKTARFVN
jgi:hypothetical protein